MSFWERVDSCKHENLYDDFYEDVYCSTYSCEGSVVHCRDCGAFISRCSCMVNNGISGWPPARWKKFYDRNRN